ncbi:hypothetical protein GJV52_00775 [Neisseria brasiliensis]|uniref:Uncharacterized protein n=1 Tax=Neisseria brasiliensis TaxID=2666100 RepID=A0A5Q3RV96_9NEIS|nr:MULTISPECIES: hypothetical protein [Neisseria]MRN37202.1 hypothetical protein [Neisseria brasiliensis]QGL24211.1 hypothetical protein GJV52_00775 [Neisseria brasiliensis]
MFLFVDDSRKDGTPSRRLPSPVGGSISIKATPMHDAEIIQVITPPLFFCGVYYRRALCRFDGGVLALRNIQFSTPRPSRSLSRR